MKNWRKDASVEPLTEGTRGSGRDAGEVGLADFLAGTYPACSNHGALLSVGQGRWRCITGMAECNVGATWIKIRKCPEGHPTTPASKSVVEGLWFCSACSLYYGWAVVDPPAPEPEWQYGRPSERP